MGRIIDKVDVIAEFKADGTIIPMRFRIMNEDGVYEQFNIKAVKQKPTKGTHTTEDGLYVSASDLIFECMIVALNTQRLVRLYFIKNQGQWKLGF